LAAHSEPEQQQNDNAQQEKLGVGDPGGHAAIVTGL
jgi:hypothetical protein